MTLYVGVDGIPGGWVAVYINGNGAKRFEHSSSLGALLRIPYTRAMVDIPIGLPERGYRECDIQAKRIVGSRVFLGARWNVWRFESFPEANAYYWSIQDKGISKQLWSIRGKLQEVNGTMTPKRQSKLKETHHELVFWRVAGGIILQSKKSDAGREQRITLLKQHGFDQIDLWLEQRRGTGVGRDDLIDACACALAARDGKQRLPKEGANKAGGIRMEIWF